ncbi:MAG: CAP domain-containing protein, partial [Candidatus Shapirobacteria bacterium]|nr:CAP domain-containing protein [Candidatus Shapirobacteria bacterium]
TNQKRAENGLTPLALNGKLNEVAQRKAGDMFAFNYWAHVSPSGRSPWSFFQEVGYKYLYAGENLARDFMNSEAVVEAWMNSPSHRDNLLNPNYKEIGLSVVNGTLNGVETTLVVQMFGTPTSTPVAQKQAVLPSQQATIIKTTTPTPIPSPVSLTKEEKLILPEEKAPLAPKIALAQAKGEVSNPPLFSPFLLTKTIAIFLLGLILGALALDTILVYQRKIIRLSGKNVAHLIFIGSLLLAIILTTPGAVL